VRGLKIWNFNESLDDSFKGTLALNSSHQLRWSAITHSLLSSPVLLPSSM
jgi:hypothetical protein